MSKPIFEGYAALEKSGPLKAHSFPAQDLAPKDVEVKISHCGICHSDLHLIDNDWGISNYPLIPGHEIVGTVSALGSEVTSLVLGQRVGIGWQSESCLECEWCASAQENLCRSSESTCVGRPGGFANRIRIDSRFAFPLPEALASRNAAPLLCGGITVYSPLRHHEVKPHHKVGIVGIGGLGHLAIQFAAKMGCEVTAFSSTPAKEAEAKALGATHFINSRDPEQLKAARNSLDFILSTVYTQLDWPAYVKILRPNGKLCFVGAAGKVNIAAGVLLGGQKSITGSIIGGRARIREMLDFAARHQIEAMTEVMPMPQLNEALDKLRSGTVRYRMVLET